MISDKLITDILTAMESEFDYLGIGTGSTPAESDTLLDSEALRKAVEIIQDGNTLVVSAFWDTGEANGVNYTNSGAFKGGSTTVDTGELVAGFGTNFTKTSNETLTISYEISVARGA